MTSVSIVIPLYRCSQNVSELERRLHSVMKKLHVSYELLLVDDGSPDDQWKSICACVRTSPCVVGIRLKSNIGQQKAIAVGLSKVRGYWTIVMDGDLQDRPEDIPALLQAAKKTQSVVIARRTFRRTSIFYMTLSRIYHGIISVISNHASDASLGNFTVLDQKTCMRLQRTSHVGLSYLQSVRRIATNIIYVDVVHDERAFGTSSYNFMKLFRLAFIGFYCWVKPIQYHHQAISYDDYIQEIKR